MFRDLAGNIIQWSKELAAKFSPEKLAGQVDDALENAPVDVRAVIAEYAPRIKELLAQQYDPTASLEDQLAAEKEIDQIREGIKNSEARNIVGDLETRLVADMIEGTSGKPVSGSQRDIIKKTIMGKAGLAAIQAGAGIMQVLGANSKLKDLVPPKQPDDLKKNPQLSTLLSQQLSKAAQGDPQVRKSFEEGLAEQTAIANERAKSSGTIGQYTGNLQGNALRELRALRDFATDEANRKRQDTSLAGQLVQQSINEDFRIQDDKFRKYRVDNLNYLSSLNALQGQKNSGFNNLFVGLQNASEVFPYSGLLSDLRARDFATSREGEEAIEPLPASPERLDLTIPQLNQDIGTLRTNFRKTPPYMEGEFRLLGGTDRTPESISRFQEYARSRNKLIDDEYGQWGLSTQKAYDELRNPSPLEMFNVLNNGRSYR